MKARTLKSAVKLGLCAAMSAVSVAAMAEAANTARNRQTSDAIFTEPRDSAISQLLFTVGDIVAFQIVRPKLPEATAITEADQRILQAMNSSDPEDVKIRNIREAETDLAKARLVALNSLEHRSLIPSFVRYARVVGSTLVLVDIAGRAWVWNALHANPTWSPVVTTFARVGDGLSTQNALPAR